MFLLSFREGKGVFAMCGPIALKDLPEGQLALYFRGGFKRSLTLARVGTEVRHYFNLRQSTPRTVSGSYEVCTGIDLETKVTPLDQELVQTAIARAPKEQTRTCYAK